MNKMRKFKLSLKIDNSNKTSLYLSIYYIYSSHTLNKDGQYGYQMQECQGRRPYLCRIKDENVC